MYALCYGKQSVASGVGRPLCGKEFRESAW